MPLHIYFFFEKYPIENKTFFPVTFMSQNISMNKRNESFMTAWNFQVYIFYVKVYFLTKF